jgi:hypothetical protein
MERGIKIGMANENTDQKADAGQQSRKLTVVEHDLPAYWASYLINGDDSGIEPKDQYEADKFLAEHNLPMPVSCEPAGIGRYNGLMSDMETFTFLL